MSIRLTWPAVNSALADNIVIYRALAPIPANDLPAPLVTLPGTTTTYDDLDVGHGVVYHYRVAAVKGTDVLLTDNQIYGHFPNNGPGAQKPIRGNWDTGYFGRILPGDFISATDLRTLCGMTGIGSPNGDASLTHWLKFIYKGKILFIPNAGPNSGATWKQIYDRGLVYGTNDFGSPPAGVTSVTFNVNQRKIITARGLDFLVRLPKASQLPTSQVIVSADANDGEWVTLMGRAGITTSRPTTQNKWDDFAPSNLFGGYTQHLVNTTQAMAIGEIGSSDASRNIALTTADSGTAWLPILELQY